ncbi:MAG: helix-turn-helix transcriptional regulator [Myxococcota bacterium]
MSDKNKELNPDYVRVGAILRSAREKREIQQQDLAKVLGRSHGSLSLIEHGKSNTTLDLLQRYGNKVGVYVTVVASDGNHPAEDLAARILRLGEGLTRERALSISALLTVWEQQDNIANTAG